VKAPVRFTHRFVEYIPERPEPGMLYVSVPYATVVHRCGCGCGNKVVTPLSPFDWKLAFDGKSISLYPVGRQLQLTVPLALLDPRLPRPLGDVPGIHADLTGPRRRLRSGHARRHSRPHSCDRCPHRAPRPRPAPSETSAAVTARIVEDFHNTPGHSELLCPLVTPTRVPGLVGDQVAEVFLVPELEDRQGSNRESPGKNLNLVDLLSDSD
jgi:hypothetical protein